MKEMWQQARIAIMVLATTFAGLYVAVGFHNWHTAQRAVGILLIMSLCGADFGWLVQYPFWTVVKDFKSLGIKGVKIILLLLPGLAVFIVLAAPIGARTTMGYWNAAWISLLGVIVFWITTIPAVILLKTGIVFIKSIARFIRHGHEDVGDFTNRHGMG